MAKSKNFFGLRKNSTKSHTYQALRGRQITKDRVYDVANPQTDAQMKRRVLLPMVASAAAQLEGLVNHSFEGVEYGYKSVSEFRRLNLAKNALTPLYAGYIAKGFKDCGVADFIVSNGRLPGVEFDYATSEDLSIEDWELGDYALISIKVNAALTRPKAGTQTKLNENPAVLAILANFFNASDIDQISILIGREQIPYVDMDDRNAPRHSFALSRISFSGDADINGKWTVKTETYMNTTTNEVSWVNTSVTDGITRIAFGNIEDKGVMAISPVATATTSQRIAMAAIIRSAKTNGTWQRSFSRLVVNDYGDLGRDWTLSEAIATYKKSETASAKYLNEGNESTGILGDD